jgi:hypothetical protein
MRCTQSFSSQALITTLARIILLFLKKDSTFLDVKAMGTRAQHKRIII